jgi:NADH dehydrogenase
MDRTMADGPVTVFGGSGFLGRRIVDRLSAAAIPVRIATRRPKATGGAEALGGRRSGWIEWRRADVQDGASVAAAVAGARGVVNAVSLYAENGGSTFRSVHVEGARTVALQSRSAGVPTLVHISGLGADAASPSAYIRSRGEGEAAVREGFEHPTILRPSIMFGIDDAFLNGLARVVSILPVIPLFGDGGTRLQPVWVGDVAAAARLFDGAYERAPVYELGGPRVYAYREIVELIAAHMGKRRILSPLPFEAWRLAAAAGRFLPGFPLSGPQVDLMRKDNIVGSGYPTLTHLNIDPKPLEEILAAIVGTRPTHAGGKE